MFGSRALRLLFPPLCLHCQEDTGCVWKSFCAHCQEFFALLSPVERCSRCFFPLEECSGHRTGEFPFTRVAAACEYWGPPATLVRALKYQRRPYLAKDAAALLVVQLLTLEWPIPDLIVPVPQAFTRTLLRGYNQSGLIAQEMGKLLNVPIAQPLKRRSGDLPQAALNKAQRERLSVEAFSWKKPTCISEQCVLVVDDVRTTGTTLYHTGSVLKQRYPGALYGMAFCT